MLFMLPVASVYKYDKAGARKSQRIVSNLRTIAYKLAIIQFVRTRGTTKQ